jgi:hypothetical protein
MTKKNMMHGVVHLSCWQSPLAIWSQRELFYNMQPMLTQRTERDGQVLHFIVGWASLMQLFNVFSLESFACLVELNIENDYGYGPRGIK